MALFRSTSLLRLGLACWLLVSGCSLLPSVLSAPSFQADALVGADTWSFTDVTMRPSLQQALRTGQVMDLFVGPLEDAGADLSSLPTPSGRLVDFEQDILPFLDGEIAVAVSGPIDEPQFVLLVQTNDVDGLMRLLADTSQPRLVRDARGATRYDGLSGSPDVVGYKNWIVYSESSDLRDQTLDRIDGGGSPSLASDGRYRGVVDKLAGDRLGFGYMDVSPLLDLVSQEDPRLTAAVQARGRMAYAFGFEPGPQAGVHVLGMRVEFIPDEPRVTPIRADDDTLLAMDRLPKASMVAVAGPDLGMYSESLATLGEYDELPDELQLILDQFSGPYAVGVTQPSMPRRAFDERPFDEAIGSFMGGLFLIARLAPGADTALIGEVASTLAAEADDGGGTWQHEVVVDNDWLAINAVPPPLSLDEVPEDLLASDQMYQWVRPGFIRNGTNIFLNLEALETTFLGSLASGDELAVLRLFRGIGISSQTDAQGDSRARMTVLIVE
jgi:hypothetical protein